VVINLVKPVRVEHVRVDAVGQAVAPDGGDPALPLLLNFSDLQAAQDVQRLQLPVDCGAWLVQPLPDVAGRCIRMLCNVVEDG
jgi:hypothetical protein